MEDFKIEKITFGNRVVDQLTDSDGLRWYPLKMFLQRVLYKMDDISSYRDSNLSRYMKIFEYIPDGKKGKQPLRVWCMNEKGIKVILKNIKIFSKANVELYNLRERGLYEACEFFKVKTIMNIKPLYIQTFPNIDNYDVWSVQCLQNDLQIGTHTIWKRCSECERYFPNNAKYYNTIKRKTINKCKQCNGTNFKNDNKVLQFFFEHGRVDLLFAIYNNDKEEVLKRFYEMIGRRGSKIDN